MANVLQVQAAGFHAVRQTQAGWRDADLAARLAVMRRLRTLIVRHAEALAAAALRRPGQLAAEKLVSEVIPLADACRFLEREAPRLLRTRRLGPRGRPYWLAGVSAEVQRQPLGVVLVVGPANYPLLLPGVQTIQALTAGNAVLWKPGAGGTAAASILTGLLDDAGLPRGLVTVLGEEPEAAHAAIEEGVDKVILTGSLATGQAVLAALAPRVIPAVLELSGCDAVFVQEEADLDLVGRALAFGLRLNGGATCMAPRRVFVAATRADALQRRLDRLEEGWRLSVLPVQDDDEALAAADACPFALGAAVFGMPGRAEALARRVRAGVVVVNDIIVPTADPRLPFGGWHQSGYGVTRGAEGLLELTRVKVVMRRRGRFHPHLEPLAASDADLAAAYLAAAHGGSWPERLVSAARLVKLLLNKARTRGGER